MATPDTLLPPECERRTINVLGVDTAYYRVNNQGQTVVLLHGGAPGACSDLNWYRNFEFLVGEGYDVVAFDQPGFGYSSFTGDHSIEFRYQHAVQLLSVLGIDDVVLIGNSIGGLLATLMYLRRESLPFSVEKIVLAAPLPYFRVSELVSKRRRLHAQRLASVECSFDSVQKLCENTFFNKEKVTDELVRFRTASMTRTWPAVLSRREAGTGFEAEGLERAKIHCRSLVVWGVNDLSVPVEAGLEAVRLFTAADFVFLSECGHWPQTEQAEKFNRLVESFLASGHIRGDTSLAPVSSGI